MSKSYRVPADQRVRAEVHTVISADRIPLGVQIERERHQTALEARSPTEIMLGDPPIGYRALDQRK
jgi:hypothetical protein